KGDTGDQGPQGVAGPQGATGPAGPAGQDSTPAVVTSEYSICSTEECVNNLLLLNWKLFGGVSVDESRGGTGGNTHSRNWKQALVNSPGFTTNQIADYKVALNENAVINLMSIGYQPYGKLSYGESRGGTGGSNFSSSIAQAMIKLNDNNSTRVGYGNTLYFTSEIGPAGNDGVDGNGIVSSANNGDGTFTLAFDDGTTFTTDDLTGPQGDTGAAGTNGTNGSDGADGKGISSTVDNGDGTFTITYTDNTTFTTSDFTGPQGPQGETGAAGTNGTNGSDGADGADGSSAYEIWIAAGNTGTQQDFIDSLTGPQGPQGEAGESSPSGPNVSNGKLTFNTVGLLTDWVVPDGVYTIEIWLNGSVGGDGGDVLYSNGSVYDSGGSGGSFGSATVILNVAPGDIISYYIGNDGNDGNDATRYTMSQVLADNGTAGETSKIYRNNILGFNVSGGSGGQGGRVTSSGGTYGGDNGGPGGLDMSESIENGFFVRSSSNPYSSSKSTLVIRY
ncbi:collagen-like protein, partial [Polaribacter sp.]|nr:collagen-like protein [Polaribacter sp.]